MGGVHVCGLAADNFANPAEIDGLALRIGGAQFFPEENVRAGDADRLAAEVADHVDQARVDFVGKDAGDNLDGGLGGDPETVNEFRLKP